MKPGIPYPRKILLVLTLVLFLSPYVKSNPFTPLSDSPETTWNNDWSYHQQIQLNIDTSSTYAIYQPIDINIQFKHPCWGINETSHSIRVCCWTGQQWYELESQIYNLVFNGDNKIQSCNIIFLIPEYADGQEQYYVYYDDSEKSDPSYMDHVHIFDRFYYYEPITGISVEGDYYEIIDDDEIVYGVGQKGSVMNRQLSQIAIRMKPGTKEFDILNSDLLTSFCFSYQKGTDDEDEISSDYTLLGKEVTIDGPLMVEFIIISESEYGEITTTNVYRYYHCPSVDKRITVHVQHDIHCDLQVKGVENNDGRFGAIISYYSKSDSMKKMRFGDILPYLHVYNEHNRVNEYQLVNNPESSKREWVISYTDDCDLGPSAWISYSDGSEGKTHGIIFSSAKNIISNASQERDGIQIKVAEKEYLDLVGAEIDYASIAFGRNSYEPLHDHDLLIDKGLHVEFDAEFITIQEGTYEDVNHESSFFQNLVSFRDVSSEDSLGKQYIYTLTVIPKFTGRIASFPLLANSTTLPIPVLYGELYLNGECIASTYVQKSLLGLEVLKFPKLQSGEYLIKIYRKMGNISRYIGVGFCNITDDTTVNLYCTWEKNINIYAVDQHQRSLPNITVQLTQDSHLIHESATSQMQPDIIPIPYPFLDSYQGDNLQIREQFSLSSLYQLKAWYKGFKISDISIPRNENTIELAVPVHDITVKITDELDRPPDVNVNPFLTSMQMQSPYEIYPEKQVQGTFYFTDIPEATYEIHISYGGYEKSKTIDIPSGGDQFDMRFSYTTDLSVELLTIRGEVYTDDSLDIEIKRLGSVVFDHLQSDDILQVPPGRYTVNVYDENTLIGSQTSHITHDSVISVVTTKGSFIQMVFVASAAILLGAAIIMFLFHKITLNMFLKLVVLGLVFFSLVQPWWSFSGETDDGSMKKTSDMYLYPQIMIEEYHVDDARSLSLSTIPDVFMDFLFYLTVFIGVGMILMFISFIPNIILKRRFSLVLAGLSIVFVLIVAISFYMGMSAITQISLGSLSGHGIIDISIPSGEKVYMNANWGLGIGFYTIFFAAIISIAAGIYDAITNKREQISKRLKKTNEKKTKKSGPKGK